MAEEKIVDQYQKLQAILDWFESDQFNLDQAEVKFDEGVKLANEIGKRLKEAKLKIEKLEKLLPQ